MKKLLAILLCTWMLFLFRGVATADTLDFEDLTIGDVFDFTNPGPYGGMY